MSTVPSAPSVTHPRAVERVLAGQATSDGAGVKLTRVVDHRLARRLDPFLMLDNFRTEDPRDYVAGFPDHPHRGFETVTYILAGRMRHRDSAGNQGLLQSGGVQWMTAGRGVVHSEMPEQENGAMEGFQLWLNLPAKDKMSAPWYRDIPREELPTFALDGGGSVRVIAGESHGVGGAVTRDATAPIYVDVDLPAGGRFTQALPPGHNAFLFVYRGAVQVGGDDTAATEVSAGHMAILANDPDADGVVVTAATDSRLILVAGRPLGEPIAQYGPFVMNTEAEIRQAISDYQRGLFR